MDIKDFILIAGGILIAMVIGHGFWIALRAKREPLRLDIVPDLIPGDIDEIERLRGELPNGGGRVVNARIRGGQEPPAQQSLDLAGQAPLLMDPLGDVTSDQASSAESSVEPSVPVGKNRRAAREAAEREARVRAQQSRVQANGSDQQEPHLDPPGQRSRANAKAPAPQTAARAHIREVDLLTTTEPTTSNTEIVAESKTTTADHSSSATTGAAATPRQESAPVEELLVIHVLAPKGKVFAGEDLVGALRAQGLRYGDMSIFHRVEPTTKAHLYSVANVLEPGTFDLADLGHMRSPGMSFFLQLPGPDDASAAFADMLQATRNVAVALGGEQRDEADESADRPSD